VNRAIRTNDLAAAFGARGLDRGVARFFGFALALPPAFAENVEPPKTRADAMATPRRRYLELPFFSGMLT